MKKLYLIVLVFQLLILCSCSKPLPQGASVQGQDILEAANLEAEKSTVGLDSNEPDLSVSESVIPERTEQQADAVNQSVPSDEEIVDATADCETALAEENNGNTPAVPAVTETEMRLQQAVMQVYTGQPEADNDALAAIAHYLEVHPSVGELYLPFDDFGISIYALDGTGNSQYVLFRKKAFTVFYMQYSPENGICAIDGATLQEDAVCTPEINSLVDDAQTGASYEFIYYDLCSTDVEKAAFTDYINTAQTAIKAYFTANWGKFTWNHAESLRAAISVAVDYSIIFQIYNGDTYVAEFRYLPGMSIVEVGQ